MGSLTPFSAAPLPAKVFAIEQTHGRAMRPANRLLAHSPDSGWGALYAALMEEAPFEATEQGVRHPSFIYHISRPTHVTRRIDGDRSESALIRPRCLTLTPGRPASWWSHNGNPQILQVYVHRQLFENAAAEMYDFDPAKADIIPRFAILDPLLEQLSLEVIAALREGDRHDSLYVESLAQLAAVHMVRMHSNGARPRGNHEPAIANWKMRRLREYIEVHLDGDLTLAALAREAGVSPSVFAARIQERVWTITATQYVLARRI